MAENKKTKTDFKEALSAQASKLAPKKPSMETVKVDVGGEIVEIPRGDMTDEQWARVKQRAYKAPDAPERYSGDKIIAKKDGNKVTIVREDQTDDEWKKVTEDAKRTYGQINVEEHYTPAEERGRGETWGEGTIFPDKGSYERLKSMPEGEEKKRELMRLKQQYDKKQTDAQEKSEEMSSADPGMSVRGQMARLATGAVPNTSSLDETNAQINQTSGAAMAELPSAPKQKGPVNALKSVVAEDMAPSATPVVKPMSFGKGEQTIFNAGEQIPQEPGVLDTINNFATEARQAITDVVTDPMGTIPPMVQRLGQGAGEIINAGGPMGPVPATAPTTVNSKGETVPLTEADPVDSPMQPGSKPLNVPLADGSVSVSMKTPGNAQMPAAPVESEYEKQIKQAAREGQALIAADSELKATKAAKDFETVAAFQAEREKMALNEQKRQAVYEETMAKYENGVRDLQAQVLDLSKQDVDPNRFWNNKSDGQKAMAVLAGALYGFGGQGMQWLSRLDSLVQQDIQAQAADLNRKRGLLSDASQLQNNLVAMAEAKGLRGQAAYNAAIATAKENMATQITMNAMNFAQPELRIAAEQQALALRSSAMKDLAAVKRQAEQDAMERRYKQAQINHLEAQSFASRMSASGKNKAEGDRKLAPGTREELSKVEKGLEAIQQARDALKGGNRFTDEIANKVRKTLSAVGADTEAVALTPDTTGRTAVAESAQETALKAVMGEALQEKDIERNRPRFARPGLNADNTKWLDAQEEILIAKKNALVNAKSEDDIQPQASPLRTLTPSVE